MKYIPESSGYFVDESGNVFRKFKSNFRQLRKNNVHTGYQSVAIRFLNGKVKTFYVHRLVATLYIPNPENKPIVNHINLIKHDNRLCNLEWVTAKENNLHMREAGANRLSCGAAIWSIYTTEQIEEVCRLMQDGYRNIDIQRITGVSRTDLQSIRSRKNWRHISEKYVFSEKSRKRKLSANTIVWICHQILDGKTNSQIAAEACNEKITKDDVRQIRLGKAYLDIVSQYLN